MEKIKNENWKNYNRKMIIEKNYFAENYNEIFLKIRMIADENDNRQMLIEINDDWKMMAQKC